MRVKTGQDVSQVIGVELVVGEAHLSDAGRCLAEGAEHARKNSSHVAVMLLADLPLARGRELEGLVEYQPFDGSVATSEA